MLPGLASYAVDVLVAVGYLSPWPARVLPFGLPHTTIWNRAAPSRQWGGSLVLNDSFVISSISCEHDLDEDV